MLEQRYSIAAMCCNGDGETTEWERPLSPFPPQPSLETVATAVARRCCPFWRKTAPLLTTTVPIVGRNGFT